jgi:hypothetical protein
MKLVGQDKEDLIIKQGMHPMSDQEHIEICKGPVPSEPVKEEIVADVELVITECEIPEDVERVITECEIPEDVERVITECEIPEDVERVITECEIPEDVERVITECEIPEEREKTAQRRANFAAPTGGKGSGIDSLGQGNLP